MMLLKMIVNTKGWFRPAQESWERTQSDVPLMMDGSTRRLTSTLSIDLVW